MSRHRTIWISLATIAVVGALSLIARPFYRASLDEQIADACSANDLHRVEWLVSIGANPNGGSDSTGEHTPLLVKAMGHHQDVRIIQFLLAHGADPNDTFADNADPLSYAINERQLEAVQVLLAAGANPRYYPDWTAVDQARSLGFTELIKVVEPYLKP